ncbi:MAG TPA: HAD-IIA family hydrolase [Actinomycetes bacterium]|nr:HAD-IIA family hydrolase [Actinomycetes bacterium]
MADPGPLAGRYRAVVCDLDGVVYLRDQVIPGAPEGLRGVRDLGVAVAFVTNNSYRPPEEVAAKLQGLGVRAAAEEVLTSSQAVVHLLGGKAALAGVKALVVGGPGLRRALEEAGADIVEPPAWREAQLVVAGIDPEVTYARLAAACLAIQGGARFVGSNPDTTLPTPEGSVPGNGAFLALLTTATGVRPEVAGKPEPALFETAAAAIGGGPFLMVGDRADTDLEGAAGVGWDTALVLTGVVRPAGLLDLPSAPDHLLADLRGLLAPPGPCVREAVPAEAEAVAALLREASLSGEQAPSRIRSTLVAVDGQRVVGTLAWNRHGDEALLRGIAVASDYQGRLVGTRLVLAACLRLRAAGVRRVGVLAAKGAGFFARLGFREVAHADLPAPAALLANAAGPATPLLRELPAAQA